MTGFRKWECFCLPIIPIIQKSGSINEVYWFTVMIVLDYWPNTFSIADCIYPEQAL